MISSHLHTHTHTQGGQRSRSDWEVCSSVRTQTRGPCWCRSCRSRRTRPPRARRCPPRTLLQLLSRLQEPPGAPPGRQSSTWRQRGVLSRDCFSQTLRPWSWGTGTGGRCSPAPGSPRARRHTAGSGSAERRRRQALHRGAAAAGHMT